MLTQNIFAVLTLALAASALPTNNPPPNHNNDGNSNGIGAVVSATAPVPGQRYDSPNGGLPVSASQPVPVPTQGYSIPNVSGGLTISTSRPVTTTRPSSAAATPPSQTALSGGDSRGNQNVGNSGQNAGGSVSNSGAVRGDYTVSQAAVTCGNSQLNCCNKVTKKGDTTNAGLLGAVFGSGDIDVQCSPLNIPIIGSRYPIRCR